MEARAGPLGRNPSVNKLSPLPNFSTHTYCTRLNVQNNKMEKVKNERQEKNPPEHTRKHRRPAQTEHFTPHYHLKKEEEKGKKTLTWKKIKKLIAHETGKKKSNQTELRKQKVEERMRKIWEVFKKEMNEKQKNTKVKRKREVEGKFKISKFKTENPYESLEIFETEKLASQKLTKREKQSEKTHSDSKDNLYCVNKQGRRNKSPMSNPDIVMEEENSSQDAPLNKRQKSSAPNKTISRIQKEGQKTPAAKPTQGNSTPPGSQTPPTNTPNTETPAAPTTPAVGGATPPGPAKDTILIGDEDNSPQDKGTQDKANEEGDFGKGMDERFTFMSPWPNGPTEEEKTKRSRRDRMELNARAFEEAKHQIEMDEETRQKRKEEYIFPPYRKRNKIKIRMRLEEIMKLENKAAENNKKTRERKLIKKQMETKERYGNRPPGRRGGRRGGRLHTPTATLESREDIQVQHPSRRLPRPKDPERDSKRIPNERKPLGENRPHRTNQLRERENPAEPEERPLRDGVHDGYPYKEREKETRGNQSKGEKDKGENRRKETKRKTLFDIKKEAEATAVRLDENLPVKWIPYHSSGNYDDYHPIRIRNISTRLTWDELKRDLAETTGEEVLGGHFNGEKGYAYVDFVHSATAWTLAKMAQFKTKLGFVQCIYALSGKEDKEKKAFVAGLPVKTGRNELLEYLNDRGHFPVMVEVHKRENTERLASTATILFAKEAEAAAAIRHHQFPVTVNGTRSWITIKSFREKPKGEMDDNQRQKGSERETRDRRGEERRREPQTITVRGRGGRPYSVPRRPEQYPPPNYAQRGGRGGRGGGQRYPQEQRRGYQNYAPRYDYQGHDTPRPQREQYGGGYQEHSYNGWVNRTGTRERYPQHQSPYEDYGYDNFDQDDYEFGQYERQQGRGRQEEEPYEVDDYPQRSQNGRQREQDEFDFDETE